MADRKQSRAEAVRAAVDEAVAAAAGQAQRAQGLVGELGQAAGRMRGALDDLRPPTADEVRALRREVRELADRLDALERRVARRKPS